MNEQVLDNPIWHALTTRHSEFAEGTGLARRYVPDVGPLCAMREPSTEAWDDLERQVPAGEIAILFLKEAPTVPAYWRALRQDLLVQMICRREPVMPEIDAEIIPLGDADLPEMLALTKLTEPGPFRGRTAELGGFVGIRIEGRLAAMAGHRVAPPGFREVSAVCTHPDFRGRGYALALVAAVSRGIFAQGEVPYLTSFAANVGAIRVYEAAGYELRGHFHLAVLTAAAVELPAGKKW